MTTHDDKYLLKHGQIEQRRGVRVRLMQNTVSK